MILTVKKWGSYAHMLNPAVITSGRQLSIYCNFIVPNKFIFIESLSHKYKKKKEPAKILRILSSFLYQSNFIRCTDIHFFDAGKCATFIEEN